jgi:hypothetical protein
MRSSSWWVRFFVQTSLEENEVAIKKFEQAASKNSYKPGCQVFHLNSYHWFFKIYNNILSYFWDSLAQQSHKRKKKMWKENVQLSYKMCTLSGVFNFCTIDVNDIPNVLFLTLYNQIFINLIGKIAWIIFLCDLCLFWEFLMQKRLVRKKRGRICSALI